MPSDEVFRAATAAFSLYGGLFQGIVAVLGKQEAMELHARQGLRLGSGIAALNEARSKDSQLDMAVLAGTLCGVHSDLGFQTDVEEGRESITYTCSRCPLYEGLRNSGLDHQTVRDMCMHLADGSFSAMKSAYPNLWGAIEFRGAPDGACVERLVKVW